MNTVVGLYVLCFVFAANLLAQFPSDKVGGKKVFVIAGLEGVDGVYNRRTQCMSLASPRWTESCKLMTDDVNAVSDGLFDAGASDVVVLDAYDTGQALSALDIHPRAILLSGRPMTPTLELNSSYAAVVLAGLPAMAGAENSVLANTYDFENIHEIRVNGKATGQIGARTMLAGTFGVPVIMMFGDEAACKELRELVPEAECAVIKWGTGRGGGRSLSHGASVKLIRETAKRALGRVSAIKAYKLPGGPVEVTTEYTTGARTLSSRPREGVTQLNTRTWRFRGKDIIDAWVKFGDF